MKGHPGTYKDENRSPVRWLSPLKAAGIVLAITNNCDGTLFSIAVWGPKLMLPQKVRYLRYASSLVTAEYPQVRLIPRESQALISALFTKPSEMELFTGSSKLNSKGNSYKGMRILEF